VAGVGLALALAGCGGSGAPSKVASTTVAAAKPVEPAVRVAQSRFGAILVDRHGRTLYLFAKDKDGTSSCYGGCARVWPPAVITGLPVAGTGVSSSLLRAKPRAGGGQQLVYAGHPLYTAAADTKPGDLTGEGYLGTWQAVSPKGRPVFDPKQPKRASSY
jgi:predicted lipoprotein with Yx(FWY)xxD motif